ncbi:MAG: prepilin peptidase [Gemmataceae bacterium]
MPTTFFPNAIFAWAFVLMLVGVLAIAAYIDFKTLRVPKQVVFVLFGAGVMMSMIRGAWLGALDHRTWLFAETNIALGALDGLLFAAAGLAVGFTIFFLFWLLGIAGGGDVKVMASVGTWLGPLTILGAFLFSFPVVVLFVGYNLLAGNARTVGAAEGFTKKRRRLMSYTLPLTVAVAVLLTLSYQTELGLPPMFAR